MSKIVAIDPSGNFNYDKGHTGISCLDLNDKSIKIDTINATKYNNKNDYYKAILDKVLSFNPKYVVIENFRLQGAKMLPQINKVPETNELIVYLEEKFHLEGIKTTRQENTIKSRWEDKLLKKELKELFNYDLPIKTTIHERDSLRHLIHIYCKAFDLFKW